MNKVISKDGTEIAYEKTGSGPSLILVDGALCYLDSSPSKAFADLLQHSFTVYRYDRRGRGGSTDVQPYALEREIEDLDALIKEAGGEAFVFGQSSGGVLALEAATTLGKKIKKLALYELPFIVDDTTTPMEDDYLKNLRQMVAENRRGDAVKSFMKGVGVPSFFLMIFPLMPVWKKLISIAHTLPYDIAMVEAYQKGKPLPTKKWIDVTMPTLVAVGGKSPTWMKNAMQNLAEVLPNVIHKVIPGQTHLVKAEILVPVLKEFFEK